MREVGRLQEYSEFHPVAPIVWDVGSATDIHLIDVATAVAEGGTSRPFEEQCRWLLRQPPAPGNVSSIGALGIAKVVPEGGERSSENLAAWGALDELRTPEGQIRRQISSLLAGEALAYRDRLAQRLELLLVAMEEEGEAWSDDSPESLRRMMLFLQSQPSLGYPILTVTPSATFRVQWTADPNRHFAAEFLTNGEVRFVVFSPDPRHPERVQRISGMASWDNLMRVIEPYNVRRWAANAGA